MRSELISISQQIRAWWSKEATGLFLLAFFSKIFFFVTHLSFSQDQVRDVLFIRDLIERGNFYIPVGPSTSVGDFFLPPLYYYLHLLSQLIFFRHFYAMDFLVIVLESFTPVVIFFLAQKITRDRVVALGAAVIYIFAVGVLVASRAWNPHLVPLTSTLFITSFLCYFLEKKPVWLVGLGLSLAVLVQLHFQWFVFVPLVLVVGAHAFRQWRKTWQYLVVAGVSAVILFSPYLWYEIQSGFHNTQQAAALLSNSDQVYERVRKPVYVTFFFPNFFQRMLFGNLFVQDWDEQYEVFQTPMNIGVVAFLSLLALYVWWAWQEFRGKKNFYPVLHLSMFLIMAAFLRIYKGDKPDYYIFVFLSFLPVFMAGAIKAVLKTQNSLIKIVPFGAIVFLQLLALTRIPVHNDYHSYQLLMSRIQELAAAERVLVVPTHQELEVPLTYFLNQEYFDLTKKDTAEYYVLFCYAFQRCDLYEPNAQSSYNFFKYNHIDPVDFSYSWEHFDPERSFVLTEGNYTAHFLKVN